MVCMHKNSGTGRTMHVPGGLSSHGKRWPSVFFFWFCERFGQTGKTDKPTGKTDRQTGIQINRQVYR